MNVITWKNQELAEDGWGTLAPLLTLLIPISIWTWDRGRGSVFAKSAAFGRGALVTRAEAEAKAANLFPAHPHFRSMVADAIEDAFRCGRDAGLEEAAKVAEKEGDTNVNNPAIDMYELARRNGIRWCGEWAARKIRALKSEGRG